MDNVYLRLAKSIVGQAEVGTVNIIVFVKNGAERVNLIDAIAGLQYAMCFEGFARAGVLTLFGKRVNIIVNKNGKGINKMKFGNARVYNLDT